MRLISDDALAIITIFQEAEGEPFDGKLAVAEVILRRTQQKYASDGTVAGTVLAAYQFSGWNSPAKNRIRSAKADMDNPKVMDCVIAWEQAKRGSNLTQGALLYYNPKIIKTPPAWALPEKSRQVATVGSHVFFIPKV